MKENKINISHEDMMKILDACYQKVLEGIPLAKSPSIEEFANEYLQKYPTKECAAKEMINNQVIKCGTSGFITGFGGFITMPVTIPANLSSVLYIQMRMIACCAYMAGHDLKNDKTQTFIYACLAGVALNATLKNFGIKFGIKTAQVLINKIPGKVLIAINKKIGFRLITKAGTKGLVNLGKLVPGVGALIGGAVDVTETKIIADRAYRWFFKEDFIGDEKTAEDIIDIDALIEEDETLVNG